MWQRLRRRLATSPRYRRLRKRLGRFRRRSRFFDSARDYTPYLGAQVGSASFIVSTSDKNIGRELVVGGDRKEQRHLAHALAALRDAGLESPRRLMIDVGAHIGTAGIAAILEFAFERILAFEAERENFRLLRANAAINKLDDRMRMFEVAVSDSEGSAILNVSSPNTGAYWLVPGGTEGPGRIRVPTARLDHLLPTADVAPEEVDLLWTDVQGHEGHVLAGASRLLAIGVPTVFELSPRHLRRADGLDLLVERVQQSFTHLVDLRRPGDGPLPTNQMTTLIERYQNYFTDVLAYRVGL